MGKKQLRRRVLDKRWEEKEAVREGREEGKGRNRPHSAAAAQQQKSATLRLVARGSWNKT